MICVLVKILLKKDIFLVNLKYHINGTNAMKNVQLVIIRETMRKWLALHVKLIIQIKNSINQ